MIRRFLNWLAPLGYQDDAGWHAGEPVFAVKFHSIHNGATTPAREAK